MRKFAPIRPDMLMYGQKTEDIKMPVRATKHAVCYDCYSPIDEVIEAGDTKLIFINCKAYCNEDEGFMLFNHGKEAYVVKKGDKIGQIFFFKFLTVDDEEEIKNVRKGGFGSTNKQ